MIIFKDDEILLDLPKMLSETDLIKDIENRYIQIEPQTEIGQLMNFLNNIETWSISRDIPWGLTIPETNYAFDTWFNSSLYPIAAMLKLGLSELPEIQMITGRDILFFWCAKMLIIWNWLHKHKELHNFDFIHKNKYPFKKNIAYRIDNG